MVRVKLVSIQNSRGIGLATPWLAVAELADEVEIEAAPGVMMIRPSTHVVSPDEWNTGLHA